MGVRGMGGMGEWEMSDRGEGGVGREMGWGNR